MNQFELVDDESTFFAPVSTSVLDSLIGQYDATKARILSLSETVTGEVAETVHYFLEAAKVRDRHHSAPSVSELFNAQRAVAALNSGYWSKALQLTDVLDYMPQARRDEWHKTISEHKAPEFTAETVRATLTDLLSKRSQFLAERVDGIFRNLSGEHVTNAPEGFGRRMIIGFVLNSYYSTNHGRAGYINDLRAVIAKFMGRDEPKWTATSSLIDTLKRNWGQWVTVDGGALRMRLYKKGTAHLEVHPDMAWRLNCVLAQLYPLAIPSQFRKRPERKAKAVAAIMRPLPFAVINRLYEFKRDKYNNKWSFWRAEVDKHVEQQARQVIESMGGVRDNDCYHFDYDPTDVLDEIINSGCVPDHKSHQYYPTPPSLAKIAVELAEIGDTHTVLEPSAGQGGLADILPGHTVCVELSKLHCKVLQAKGKTCIEADFLAHQFAERFDRIVMNPPFDQGRWQAHLERAASLVKPGGRLVAILPSGAKNRSLILELPGMNLAWHGPYDKEFQGTAVSVIILVAQNNYSPTGQ